MKDLADRLSVTAEQQQEDEEIRKLENEKVSPVIDMYSTLDHSVPFFGKKTSLQVESINPLQEHCWKNSETYSQILVARAQIHRPVVKCGKHTYMKLTPV